MRHSAEAGSDWVDPPDPKNVVPAILLASLLSKNGPAVYAMSHGGDHGVQTDPRGSLEVLTLLRGRLLQTAYPAVFPALLRVAMSQSVHTRNLVILISKAMEETYKESNSIFI